MPSQLMNDFCYWIVLYDILYRHRFLNQGDLCGSLFMGQVELAA